VEPSSKYSDGNGSVVAVGGCSWNGAVTGRDKVRSTVALTPLFVGDSLFLSVVSSSVRRRDRSR